MKRELLFLKTCSYNPYSWNCLTSAAFITTYVAAEGMGVGSEIVHQWSTLESTTCYTDANTSAQTSSEEALSQLRPENRLDSDQNFHNRETVECGQDMLV